MIYVLHPGSIQHSIWLFPCYPGANKGAVIIVLVRSKFMYYTGSIHYSIWVLPCYPDANKGAVITVRVRSKFIDYTGSIHIVSGYCPATLLLIRVL